jgi:hypothetical protein
MLKYKYMKIQTLNKTQQKRLISLCKEFFPEYGEPQIINYQGSFAKKDINSAQQIRFYNKTQLIHIHWYQLCLTELPKRIVESLKSNIQYKFAFYDSYHLITLEDITETNPVDYLWNFVKECKKNKYFKK